MAPPPPLHQELLHRRHATSMTHSAQNPHHIPKDHPTITDFENFYTRVVADYGRSPSTSSWSQEINAEYPSMGYQAAFLFWKLKHEKRTVLARSRTPSPTPHHTAEQVKQAMLQTDFKQQPRRLIEEILIPQGFPLLIVGQNDGSEFCLIPAPHVIHCDKTVFPPFDEWALGHHILSVIGKQDFTIHLLGTLRKREVYEEDLPWRESGYCMALGIDGNTGRAGSVYAIKCQQGDCWLGHIADGVQNLGPAQEISFATVFREDKWGVRLCRTLQMQNGTLWGSA